MRFAHKRRDVELSLLSHASDNRALGCDDHMSCHDADKEAVGVLVWDLL